MRGNKESTAKRTSAGKAQPGSATVEAYFARLPEPARTRLDEVRNRIRSAVPNEAAECISYSMPAFRYEGALVCYSAFKKRYSLLPMNAQLNADLGNEVSAYKTSKGTLQIPLDTPPPTALIGKVVKMRVAQNQKRKKS